LHALSTARTARRASSDAALLLLPEAMYVAAQGRGTQGVSMLEPPP
jgi:hypothetical protein